MSTPPVRSTGHGVFVVEAVMSARDPGDRRIECIMQNLADAEEYCQEMNDHIAAHGIEVGEPFYYSVTTWSVVTLWRGNGEQP